MIFFLLEACESVPWFASDSCTKGHTSSPVYYSDWFESQFVIWKGLSCHSTWAALSLRCSDIRVYILRLYSLQTSGDSTVMRECAGETRSMRTQCPRLKKIRITQMRIKLYHWQIHLCVVVSFFFPSQVLAEAERAPLQGSSRNLTYDLLCALANPNRVDTRGLSHLAGVAERFAFSLLTHSQCEMWVSVFCTNKDRGKGGPL